MSLFTIGIYLLAMLAVGVANQRRVRAAEGFFVAERRGGGGLLAASLLATILGASATLGLAGRAATVGLPAAWWLLAGCAGLLLLAGWVAPRLRAYQVYTLPELLAAQYGSAGLRRLAGAVIVVAWLGVTAAQLVGTAQVLHQVAGGAAEVWTAVAAAVLIAYTVLGGQWAVLRTDAWQLLVMLLGFGVALLLAWGRVGGWDGLQGALPAELLRFPVNRHLPAGQVAGWLLLVGLPYAAGPDMVGRLLCARDLRAARQAALGAALGLLPAAFVVALLGLLAVALDPTAPSRQALLTVLVTGLPAWAAGWLAAALLAALMSSAATCLLTTATILVRDLARCPAERAVQRTRQAVLLVGLLALAVALGVDDIIGALLWAYGVYSGGLALPVLCGCATRRPPARAVWAAVVGGGGVALAGSATQHEWGLAALATNAALLLLLSLAALPHRRGSAGAPPGSAPPAPPAPPSSAPR
ncbi:MAG: sodium:solute symporter family protein [Fimbriimonadaceae bacterium]|nr:sodium:solute symporter family protein [Fimbriimonadaceae bacterium]